MDRKNFEFDIKATDGNTFSGLASVFGNVDLGGDIVAAGAFQKSLADHRKKGRVIPILWQHKHDEPIGYWKNLEETDDGLRGDGVLEVENDALARRAMGLIKVKAISGLSIGYDVAPGGSVWKGDDRILTELDLWEVSVVTFPMNDEARIDAVKMAAMSDREIERKLTQDAGLSRSVARALMRGGIKQIRGMQDADADLSEIAALLIARNL